MTIKSFIALRLPAPVTSYHCMISFSLLQWRTQKCKLGGKLTLFSFFFLAFRFSLSSISSHLFTLLFLRFLTLFSPLVFPFLFSRPRPFLLFHFCFLSSLYRGSAVSLNNMRSGGNHFNFFKVPAI